MENETARAVLKFFVTLAAKNMAWNCVCGKSSAKRICSHNKNGRSRTRHRCLMSALNMINTMSDDALQTQKREYNKAVMFFVCCQAKLRKKPKLIARILLTRNCKPLFYFFSTEKIVPKILLELNGNWKRVLSNWSKRLKPGKCRGVSIGQHWISSPTCKRRFEKIVEINYIIVGTNLMPLKSEKRYGTWVISNFNSSKELHKFARAENQAQEKHLCMLSKSYVVRFFGLS